MNPRLLAVRTLLLQSPRRRSRRPPRRRFLFLSPLLLIPSSNFSLSFRRAELFSKKILGQAGHMDNGGCKEKRGARGLVKRGDRTPSHFRPRFERRNAAGRQRVERTRAPAGAVLYAHDMGQWVGQTASLSNGVRP
ncbi:hypothetical protein HPP92_013087 [Vanilla planifolia]|uniref:Uncharacterized protein n=1 Tax=Vanilla planifolia TaxID=51239 RepID=A0A835UYA6_VANPL|nr:hypothetical protein HPP92_013087 [Vanilla planifolia]